MSIVCVSVTVLGMAPVDPPAGSFGFNVCLPGGAWRGHARGKLVKRPNFAKRLSQTSGFAIRQLSQRFGGWTVDRVTLTRSGRCFELCQPRRTNVTEGGALFMHTLLPFVYGRVESKLYADSLFTAGYRPGYSSDLQQRRGWFGE